MDENDFPSVDGLKPRRTTAAANRPSGWRIVPVSVVTLAGGALLINLAAPMVGQRLIGAANRLVAASEGRPAGIRQASLAAANLLSPGNRAAASIMALQQARNGQEGMAVQTLANVRDQSGSEAAYRTAVIATSLENAQVDTAVTSADAITSMPQPGDEAMVMAALAFGVGDKPAQAVALADRVGSPEARRSVLAASASKLALARELQASGLYKSSSIITGALSVSASRNILLGKAYEQSSRAGDLDRARSLYQEAIKLDVTSRESRTGLIRVLERSGQTDAAKAQQQALDRLNAGKP